ncbi:hypothetical protein [Acidithiobacillus ferriphilus]|uniref:Uncharacterized protein n=2 Tax=Acidithiobacillus TaxID=119977 RepID=A0A2Z6IES2_ACIFI|nr:hypothetical protein [Acidithiobacillus ferriphilus]QQD72678.1 hypothetical protein H2515_15210 [Acidithiobacillus ferrivorans]BBF63789.1 hypothetical protein AFERRID_00070 [Acidithiobacillus ferridurans]
MDPPAVGHPVVLILLAASKTPTLAIKSFREHSQLELMFRLWPRDRYGVHLAAFVFTAISHLWYPLSLLYLAVA